MVKIPTLNNKVGIIMRIGIVGLAGTGKDTVAQMLSEFSGLPVVALAKPLHDAVIHIWGKDYLERDKKEQQHIFGNNAFEWFYEWHIKRLSEWDLRYGIITERTLAKLGIIGTIFQEKGKLRETISPREFMQLYGTEFWREIYPEIFIKLACDQYESCIISDIRFENEASMCDRLIVVKRNGVEPVNAHSSELFAVSGFEHINIPYQVIENNGTLDDLKESVKKCIDNI